MGKGYFILLWDNWGAGLVRINPRLFVEGEDMYGNPKNWWSLAEDDDSDDSAILKRHAIKPGTECMVIRD